MTWSNQWNQVCFAQGQWGDFRLLLQPRGKSTSGGRGGVSPSLQLSLRGSQGLPAGSSHWWQCRDMEIRYLDIVSFSDVCLEKLISIIFCSNWPEQPF